MPKISVPAAALFVLLSVSCGNGESKNPASPGVPTIDITTLHLEFVKIPAGRFAMGSDSRKAFDQNPIHEVTISRGFELQKTEVTQAQWSTVMGSNPSHFRGDTLPVDQVSWNDVQEFIRRLNASDPGKRYRLPTEAEWEYACRAGTTESRYGDIDAVAWYDGNSEERTHPVGTKKPNAWGLYDMLGNVWELCADWKDSYPAGPVTDPAGPATGYYKVSRGGGWYDTRPAVNATFRSSPEPVYRGSSLGFRLARD